MTGKRAQELRNAIEQAATSLDDNTALTAVELFQAWKDGAGYLVTDRVRYGGVLYKCLQAHTAQASWTPDAAPSLWAKVLTRNRKRFQSGNSPTVQTPILRAIKLLTTGKAG